ncbi:protein phosphatase 2C domain-containing protein [Alsobacter sp. R-9]
MGLRFSLLDHLTHGPKPPNEDAYGATDHAAWVIDGATGVTLGPDILAPSGAAWLAMSLSQVLHDLAPARPSLPQLLHETERAVAERFDAALDPGLRVDAPDLPTGCLGLAQLAGTGLSLSCIGDVSLLHRSARGRVSVLSDPAVEAFGERTLDALRRALRERPDEDPWPALRVQIRENRRMANVPGGYRVVHPRRPWAGLVTTIEVPAAPGDILLLATDGFFRLVDHFELHDAEDLVDTALAVGLAPMLERLREAERADPRGDRALRVKTHDDATAVLLRIDAEDNTS